MSDVVDVWHAIPRALLVFATQERLTQVNSKRVLSVANCRTCHIFVAKVTATGSAVWGNSDAS